LAANDRVVSAFVRIQSPGGEPNLVLNQRRLERAGLQGKVIAPAPGRKRSARSQSVDCQSVYGANA
jgi:hypothetical protein